MSAFAMSLAQLREAERSVERMPGEWRPAVKINNY
jgi:hypothetical protein